jgi:hypothetical protein
MTLKVLIKQLNKFVDGCDISVQWAKDTESLLDEIEDSESMYELEDVFDRLQDHLSLYSPGGGDHLIDEIQMKSICKRTISILKSKES